MLASTCLYSLCAYSCHLLTTCHYSEQSTTMSSSQGPIKDVVVFTGDSEAETDNYVTSS